MLANNKATLFLVATPIGNLNEVSKRTLDVLNSVDVIACEDTRNSLKLLTHFDIHTRMISYHNFNEQESAKGIIKLLSQRNNVALISDAGYPLISDPGYELVNEVISNGFNITTISGPNACLNGLVASGLKTNHFLFYGFLDSKISKARKELLELQEFPYTLVFYEAPHRIEKTLNLMLEIFGDRKCCLARELTKLHEEYIRGTLSELCKLKDLKGEMVVIVDGYLRKEVEVKKEDLLIQIDELVKSGNKIKQAIQIVCEKYNIPKKDLYNDYVANRK